MYMKVFPHGQGGGDGPTHYLVRPDYPGRKDHPPEVLRGDLDLTRALIDSLDTKWKFTAGVLSWHPDDKVTLEQERCVMDDFEAMAFAGLDADQRNILWVRHTHADHHELHFVIPRVELSTGKAFNPCPPGWQKHFDVFRDLHNHREGWARPDDSARARSRVPEHADLHNARLLRWGKTPSRDERAAAKEAVHAFLMERVKMGMITDRSDVLTALREAGLDVNRAGKDYVTIKDPESGEKLRLKGGIYAEHWRIQQHELVDSAHEGQGRTGPARNGSLDSATVRRLEQELERIIKKRAQYNRSRYPAPARQIGAEHDFTLSDNERRLWLEMLASSGFDLVYPHRHDIRRLELVVLGREKNYGPAPGNNHAFRAERSPGSTERQNMGHVQGIGAVSRGGQGLSANPGRLDHHLQRDARQAGRLENSEEISHDRTGTHSQNHTAQPGARIERHPGSAQRILDQPSIQSGEPRPGYPPVARAHRETPSRTTGISAALATLEHCVRELATALNEIEPIVERKMKKFPAHRKIARKKYRFIESPYQ